MSSRQASYGCQAADVASTAIALHAGASEANPVMAGVLRSAGWPGFIAVKLVMAAVLDHYSKEAPKAVAAANTATCAVAVHNLIIAH